MERVTVQVELVVLLCGREPILIHVDRVDERVIAGRVDDNLVNIYIGSQ